MEPFSEGFFIIYFRLFNTFWLEECKFESGQGYKQLGHLFQKCTNNTPLLQDDEDLICITEEEQHKIPIGIAQNIKQLESACETKRREADFWLYLWCCHDEAGLAILTIRPWNNIKGQIELTDDALVYNSVELKVC